MDIRTLVLGLGVFCATFLIGWWLNISAFVYGTGALQAQPAAVAAVPVSAAATTGQSTQRSQVVHVPQMPSAQPKAPAPKANDVQPQDSFAKNSQAKPAPRKSGIRIRRR
jgi:hypothetical protein